MLNLFFITIYIPSATFLFLYCFFIKCSLGVFSMIDPVIMVFCKYEKGGCTSFRCLSWDLFIIILSQTNVSQLHPLVSV